MATAAEWFVDDLKHRGISWMATLTGHGLDPLFRAAAEAGLQLVDTRNEQTASYIAEAYGRLMRIPGVCAVSSGTGHVNAMSGVAAGWFDRTPMLLISGAGELRTAGMGHYQDMNQAAVAAPVTKYSRVIDRPERTRQILAEALDHAETSPPGPVHLTFPLDVQRAEVEEEHMIAPAPRPEPMLPVEDPEEAARLLATSERPLIIAGTGVSDARSGTALADFVEEFPIPVVVPIWDRGAIDTRVKAFMGVIGAASGGPKLLCDADCIIMAGAVPDYRVGYLQPGAVREDAVILYFERAWQELQEVCRYERVWEDRSSPEEHACAQAQREWFEEARRRRDEFRHAVEARGAEQAARGTHAMHIISALRDALSDDACLLIDGGNIGQWAHQLLCDRYPANWLTCGRGGAVGWGIGGAMGARLAFREGTVVLLSGDGAFTFNVSDLESAVRQNLHFVAIVADDQGWGQMQAGLGAVRFAELAQSLGARGVSVHRPEEIRSAIEHAIGAREVTVIHVPIVGGAP